MEDLTAARAAMDEAAQAWLIAVNNSPGDAALQQALQDWLAMDPVHRAAFDKVSEVGRLTGLLAPTGAQAHLPSDAGTLESEIQKPVTGD